MERSPWCDGDDLECRQTCPHFPYYCGDGLREEGGQMTYCPVCGAPMHDVERVEAKITPASVPEGAEGYSVTRRYMVVKCEKGHLLVAGGGNGVMAECSLSFDQALRAWPLGRSFDDVRKVVG